MLSSGEALFEFYFRDAQEYSVGLCFFTGLPETNNLPGAGWQFLPFRAISMAVHRNDTQTKPAGSDACY
jgi:hypothetical protein